MAHKTKLRNPLRLSVAESRLRTLLLRIAAATLDGKPAPHIRRLERALMRAAQRVSRLEAAAARAERREEEEAA